MISPLSYQLYNVTTYLDVRLDTLRLQKMEKEDGIVLVDLDWLQELLCWFSHLVLRRESLLEIGCQLLNVLSVHLHFITRNRSTNALCNIGKLNFIKTTTAIYLNWYPWWLADIVHFLFHNQYVFHLTRVNQWFTRFTSWNSADRAAMLLGLNFKGNGGSRVTECDIGARHQHSRLSIHQVWMNGYKWQKGVDCITRVRYSFGSLLDS